MNESEMLRKAIAEERVPRDLEARVRTRLARERSIEWRRPASSFALLAVVLVGMQVYALQSIKKLFRIGADDHVHCAIAGVYPRQTQRVQMELGLGPFAPMLQPVLDQAGGLPVVSAHRCTAEGRNYVHIILRQDRTLISVVLTRRMQGDTFPRAIGVRTVHAADITIHEGMSENYSVAGFQSGDFLAYIVSNLPDGQNNDLAVRLAPVIRKYTGA